MAKREREKSREKGGGKEIKKNKDVFHLKEKVFKVQMRQKKMLSNLQKKISVCISHCKVSFKFKLSIFEHACIKQSIRNRLRLVNWKAEKTYRSMGRTDFCYGNVS